MSIQTFILLMSFGSVVNLWFAKWHIENDRPAWAAFNFLAALVAIERVLVESFNLFTGA
jgi:hypothetical protein